MNAGNTTPRGKADSTNVNPVVEMFDAVRSIYQSAWSREDVEQKTIQSIAAAVSLIAPLAVAWAAIDARMTADDRFHTLFYIILVFLPPVLFVSACYVLKKYGKDNAPLLAFAVLLFVPGAVFTSNEVIDHTTNRTIRCYKQCTKAGIDGIDCVLRPPECNLNDADDTDKQPPQSSNPPWGDFLLAFSAFCVLVEEFSLFGMYQLMYRRVKETERLKKDADREYAGLIERTEKARKVHDDLTRLHEDANTLYRNMSRQSREWNESRQAVLLKACGVVGIIVLAFTSMCG